MAVLEDKRHDVVRLAPVLLAYAAQSYVFSAVSVALSSAVMLAGAVYASLTAEKSADSLEPLMFYE